jgi:hypothetical protein
MRSLFAPNVQRTVFFRGKFVATRVAGAKAYGAWRFREEIEMPYARSLAAQRGLCSKQAIHLILAAFLGFSLALAAFVPVSFADEASVESETSWRQVITGQLDAFRRGDSAAAFGFAAEMFHANFDDAESFAATIRRSGYGPLMDSRSHSFGRFIRDGDLVHQVVKFQGTDQTLFEALYSLGLEDGEWRVQAVQMRKQQGIAI